MKPVLKCFLIGTLLGTPLALAQGTQQQPDSEQSLLQEKPRELLPSDTSLESSGIKVVLRPCKDEDLLSAVAPGEGYKLTATAVIDVNGTLDVTQAVWSRDALHEIRQNISFAGYDFRPTKGSVLMFKVVPEQGYVFVDGSGVVLGPDNKKVALNERSKGFVVGKPAPKQKGTQEKKADQR